ncbi:MAG: MerC domain-containing protein [Salibacteraceae bacterium]
MELVQKKSDLLGTVASGLCVVHCAATPLLFVVQTCAVTGCCTGSPTWWSAIDYLFIGITAFAVYWSVGNTGKQWMKYALIASWIALTVFILNEKTAFYPIHEAFKYSSAFLLMCLHLYNKKYCQCKNEACCAIPNESSSVSKANALAP